MTSNATICFVANFDKTPLFSEVAQHLQTRYGYKVLFIATNESDLEYLLTKWPENCVLDATYGNIFNFKRSGIDLKYNELLYGDRVFRHDFSGGLDYLERLAAAVSIFIGTHDIRHFFGEYTWAHEMLIARVAKNLSPSVPYSMPHTIRLPIGRFSFFSDEFQSSLPEAPLSSDDIMDGIQVSAPDYFHQNNRRLEASRTLKHRASRVMKFLRGLNKRSANPTSVKSKFVSLRLNAVAELNKEIFKFVKTEKEIPDGPFVFVSLHKQPEASIDNCGRYYEDQYKNIVNIWRCLPQNWKLVVKDHPNAIGDRGPVFFLKLKKFTNIIIADPKSPSLNYIKNANATFTVSGTTAFEAALLGKPALTFAPCFFNIFPTCRRITLDDLRYCDYLPSLFPSYDQDKQTAAINYVYAHSAPGTVSDTASDPNVTEPENITALSKGFNQYIRNQT